MNWEESIFVIMNGIKKTEWHLNGSICYSDPSMGSELMKIVDPFPRRKACVVGAAYYLGSSDNTFAIASL